MKIKGTPRRRVVDLEREIAVLRSQVETLTALNEKMLAVLQHAATHPCPPVYVGPPQPAVNPPMLPFGPTVVPLRVAPPYIGDPPPGLWPQIVCGTTTLRASADVLSLTGAAATVPQGPIAMAFS